MAVSFAQEIRPLFTDMDIAHMKVAGVLLDDFEYMRDPAHAQKVLDAVSAGAMPPQSSGEPPWPPDRSSSSGIGWLSDARPSRCWGDA